MTSIPTAFELYFGPKAASPDVERVFFNSITLRNGTFKTTWHRRMDDLNALVQPLLPPQRPLEIMDVAVSSGVSTAEWLESLQNAGIDCNMLAGDLVVDAYLITLGGVRALTDRTGHVMQLDIGGRAVRMPPPRRRDQILYAPLITLMRAASRLCAGKGRLGIQCQPLKLTSPSIARMTKLSAVEDDILLNNSYRERFHVLRAANILNLAYFDAPTLERMVGNLGGRLVPGGLFIVCRTDENGTNNATVFTLKEDGGFALTARLNQGSEITDLVLSINCKR
jgi:hypothetical protein